MFKKSNYESLCKVQDIIEVQTAFVELLIALSRLITEGEDVTNEEIWEIIDIIIHRVELSPKYLYLIEKKDIKEEIGIKYYKFICNVLSKVILCTTVGLEFR